MRIPLSRPMTTAAPMAVRYAIHIRSSDCWPTPTMSRPPSKNVPGTLKSIPPVMITSIWPSAVMARRAQGNLAQAGPERGRAQIEATTTNRINAR